MDPPSYEEPLLLSRAWRSDPAAICQKSVGQKLESLGCSLRLWWKRSTAPAYLESPASRRFLQPLLLVTAAYSVFVDFDTRDMKGHRLESIFHLHWNALTLFTTMLGLCFPRTSLWRDIGLSVLFVRFTHSPKWHNEHWLAVIRLGVHVVPIVGWLSVSVVVSMALHGQRASNAMAHFSLALLTCVSVACFEYRIISKFYEDERHRLTAMRLLTHTTNGYCSLDPESSRIKFASKSLVEFLGMGPLEGTNLTDLVWQGDRGRLLEHLKMLEPPPALLTFVTSSGAGCRARRREFDAKVMTYIVCEHSVELCIQMQGEVRHGDAAGSAPDSPARDEGNIAVISTPLQHRNTDAHGLTSLNSRHVDVGVQTMQFEDGTGGLIFEEGSVGSQSSRQSVHSFWDSLRMITGCDVRPKPLIREHLGSIQEVTRDWSSLIAQVREELAEEGGSDSASDTDLMDRLRERIREIPPPPVSAEQWTNAAFRVAEASLLEWLVERLHFSEMKDHNRETAKASLAASVLLKQPIRDLPEEASCLISEATGSAGQPPPAAESLVPIHSEFSRWFKSLHNEVHPERPEPTEYEIMEHWDSLVMRELARRELVRTDHRDNASPA